MEWVEPLRHVVGDGWLLLLLLAIVGIVKSGAIPRWLGEQRSVQASERAQLSADQQQLIEHYEAVAENERRWREEDNERARRRIELLEERLVRQEKIAAEAVSAAAKAVETATLSERGNARLRHTLNNFVGLAIGAHDLAIARGEKSPFPIEWLRGLVGISDDLDEKLRSLFGHAPLPPASS